MGDMADMMYEEFLYDEDERGEGTAPTIKTCRKCGVTDLYWFETYPHRWQLYELVTDKLHVCLPLAVPFWKTKESRMGFPISGSSARPLFVRGQVFTLPQTRGKTEFRLQRPDQRSLPYTAYTLAGINAVTEGHAYRVEGFDPVAQTMYLRLVDRNPALPDDTAPETVHVGGLDAIRLHDQTQPPRSQK